MNSPNEALSLSAASDPFSANLGATALPAIDFHQTVADNPMTAALVAAAAGAGLMGLMTLSMRNGKSSSAERRAQTAVSDATPDTDMTNLRNQLSRWASEMLDSTPTRSEVRRNVSKASDSAASTWNEVRDQATGLATDFAQSVRAQVEDTADRLRPKVSAAVDLAKQNPVWLGVAIAAIGAIAGASALASSRK